MSNRYWETETPQRITTNKNELEYYRVAEKLQISKSNWVDKDGKEHRGKTIVLDIAALLESGAEAMIAARGVFADIVDYIDERLGMF